MADHRKRKNRPRKRGRGKKLSDAQMLKLLEKIDQNFKLDKNGELVEREPKK